MKNLFFALLVLVQVPLLGQANLNDLLASGIGDAQRFTSAYLAPITEAGIYSISNGWYNSADSKPLGGFEISIIGNITGFKNKDDRKSFILNTADYDNLSFLDGSTSREVSTALGNIEGVDVIVGGGGTGLTFELPKGIEDDIGFIPSAYLQASVGLIKGLEVKARFLPNINFDDDVKFGLLGGGLQYDFTKLLPADKLWPIALSAVIGYTNLTGEYDIEATQAVQGNDQLLETRFSTWNFSAVVSTRKIPVINFYGGLGYISGKSTIDLLGTYEVTAGPAAGLLTDPFSIENKVNGVVANVGTKIKLGFFRFNVDYNIAEFSTVNFGLNFGFR